MKNTENKTGNLAGAISDDDKKFIKDNAGKFSPEEIAKHIRRNPRTIKKYMITTGLMKYYPKASVKEEVAEIQNSQYWPILVNQFSSKELKSFRYHWANIVKQFKDDILHTEELQIIDVVKLQLMMDRLLEQQESIKSKIEQIDKEIIAAKKANEDDKVSNLQRELAGYYAATQASSKEFNDLLKQKQAMFKDLKATREQRIKQIENNKQTLIGWIKSLLTDVQFRIDLGIRMEKERLAADVEYERLSEYYTYADNMVDQPILNFETVNINKTNEGIIEDGLEKTE